MGRSLSGSPSAPTWLQCPQTELLQDLLPAVLSSEQLLEAWEKFPQGSADSTFGWVFQAL